MEFELKKLSPDAIPAALEKAKRYRLLNEPGEAESICRDVLAVDPENTTARIDLILALSDQFGRGVAGRFDEARSLVDGLTSGYQRAYYTGLLAERRAKAAHRKGGIGCGPVTYDWLRKAMAAFEEAEGSREGDTSSECTEEVAALRWNACARKILNNPDIRPEHADDHPSIQDDY